MADLFSAQFDCDRRFQTLDSLLFDHPGEFHLHHSLPESSVSDSSLSHARASVLGGGSCEVPASSGTLCCFDQRVPDPGSVHDNPANFVMDLFQQRFEQSQVTWGPRSVWEAFNSGSSFVVGEDTGDVVTGGSGLNLELSLGLGCESNSRRLDANSEMIVENGGVYSDGDYYCDFSVGRRVSESLTGETPSTTCGCFVNPDIMLGMESDSDDVNDEVVSLMDLHSENDFSLHFPENNDGDTSTPLWWDSLHLEDNHTNTNEDFEWEEVDERFDDQRELLSSFAELLEGLESPPPVVIPDNSGSVAWEVLFINPLQGYPEPEPDEEIEADFAEYDVGQFSMNETIPIIPRPASRTIVQSLPSLVLTEEDLEKNDSVCPICMDGLTVGEEAKLLPCYHRYHGECITPWLGIRNTCPICRYELPTEAAAEYERRRQIRH